MEDVEREAELLALARHATAAQLETIVRGWRRVVAAEDAQRAFEARYLSLSYDDDGSVLVRGRLAPEEGAVLRKALEAARDALIAEARRADPGGGVPAETPDRTVDDADALAALAESALAGELAQRCGGERYQVVVHVEPAALRGEPDQMERCALEDGTPIAAATVQRMCCDASLVGLVERDGRAVSVGRKTRAVPPAMRRALRSRDGGCRFPGCTQRRFVDAHHIHHWAHGGETKLDNLVQLCRHHHRLVHEGGYRIEAHRRALIFRRPDGQAIPTIPRPRRGDPGHLTDHDHRTRIGATTCQSLRDGTPLDLPAAVDAMLTIAPIRPRAPQEDPDSS